MILSFGFMWDTSLCCGFIPVIYDTVIVRRGDPEVNYCISKIKHPISTMSVK